MKDLIDIVLKECVDNFIICETTEVTYDDENGEKQLKKDTDEIKNAKNDVMAHLKQKFKERDPNILNVMDNLGFNTNFKPSKALKARNSSYMDSVISPQISKDVERVIYILRKYSTRKGGFKDEKMKKDMPSEYNFIMKIKDLIDELGLSYTYDITTNVPKLGKYGINITDNEYNMDNFDMNNISDEFVKYWRGSNEKRNTNYADKEVKDILRKLVVDKYVRAKYGMKFEMPSISLGNQKLPNNIMIINFTSAYRCPAWNECLVKHACYARSGEQRLVNTKRANDSRSAMWLSTENDPKLLELVVNLMKSYAVKYSNVASKLMKLPEYKNYTKSDLVEELRKKQISELNEIEISEIKKNLRVTDIRLNENGDFVGQWLLDACDKIAGDFKKIGINTTAYTCRNLNFEGVKNIIINASRMQIKGSAVARYFYCVSNNIYESFDETYETKDGKLVLDKDGSIIPIPQPLYDKETGKMTKYKYYKCPCGRKTVNGKELNCYQCHMCYEPNTNSNGLPNYVLVNAHGAAKKSMPDIIPSFGISKDFTEKYSPKNVKEALGDEEYISDKDNQKMAIGIITNNAVNSLYEHMYNLYH